MQRVLLGYAAAAPKNVELYAVPARMMSSLVTGAGVRLYSYEIAVPLGRCVCVGLCVCMRAVRVDPVVLSGQQRLGGNTTLLKKKKNCDEIYLSKTCGNGVRQNNDERSNGQ